MNLTRLSSSKITIVPLVAIFLLAGGVSVHAARQSRAQERRPAGILTTAQEERVQSCSRLLQGVESKSVDARIRELEQSPTPEESLQVVEAIAKTYADIVKEQNISEPKKQEWLYSMISLNMAYLQLGGLNIQQSGDSALNKMIRLRLKEYLSPELINNKEVFTSLE